MKNSSKTEKRVVKYVKRTNMLKHLQELHKSIVVDLENYGGEAVCVVGMGDVSDICTDIRKNLVVYYEFKVYGMPLPKELKQRYTKVCVMSLDTLNNLVIKEYHSYKRQIKKEHYKLKYKR